MKVKKHDFIEIDYTGIVEEQVFDTTDEKIAKDKGIHQEGNRYKPLVVCVGEQHLLPGIDASFEGKEIGKYKLELKPDNAFGRKNSDLIKLMPASKFKEQKIEPQPGLHVNINGYMGVIKTVSGGRITVDFNHPLSGRDVTYEIEIKKIVDDKKEQLLALSRVLLGTEDVEIKVDGNKATMKYKKKFPDEVIPKFKEKIMELTKVEAEIEMKE